MNSKELLRIALKETGTTQAEVAERIGWTKQQLSGRISRNSLRADELLELLDALGVNVTLVIRDTGKAINRHLKGYGRRVKETVDGVPYDTEYSSAIANSFYADGINEYTDGKATELYVDSKSRYFFAEYYSWEGARDRIVPVSAEIAAQFIEKYGTEIDKKPRQD